MSIHGLAFQLRKIFKFCLFKNIKYYKASGGPLTPEAKRNILVPIPYPHSKEVTIVLNWGLALPCVSYTITTCVWGLLEKFAHSE